MVTSYDQSSAGRTVVNTGTATSLTEVHAVDVNNSAMTLRALTHVDDSLFTELRVDTTRIGVGGWSYGGMLTNYLIASTTRFKAATSGAGSSLQTSIYGTDQYIY